MVRIEAFADPGDLGAVVERRQSTGNVRVRGAAANNLKNIDVEFPLGVLTAVTGVSGAGKSTLVNDILHPALARQFHNATSRVGQHDRIDGLEQLDKVVALGKTILPDVIGIVENIDDPGRLADLVASILGW